MITKSTPFPALSGEEVGWLQTRINDSIQLTNTMARLRSDYTDIIIKLFSLKHQSLTDKYKSGFQFYKLCFQIAT